VPRVHRCEQARDLFGRVLEIRVEGDDHVPARMIQAGEYRRMLTVVPVQRDDSDGAVGCVQAAKHLQRPVRAAVIHEDQLVRAARPFQDGRQAPI
jgi:hypothetical protein